MPRPKFPRRRARRVSDVNRGLLDTYDKLIRLFDTVDRNIVRVADEAPAKEVAEARAALEQARRDCQQLREMVMTPQSTRWPGLEAALATLGDIEMRRP